MYKEGSTTMSYDRDYFRKMVDMIDGAAKPAVNGARTQLSESTRQIVESKKRRVVAEAKKLAKLIENSDLTEAELNELFGGLGALGKKAVQAIGGAARGVGQGIAGAVDHAGQAIGGAARGVGQAASQAGQTLGKAGQKVAQTYQAGEKQAADAKTLKANIAAATNAMNTIATIQATLAKLPTAAAVVTKGDNATIGEIKAALQAVSTPPA